MLERLRAECVATPDLQSFIEMQLLVANWFPSFQRTPETFHCPLLWLSEEVVRILPCWVLMHAARAQTMLLSFASFRHIPVGSCTALFYGYLDGDCCSISWFKYLPTMVLRFIASPHVSSLFWTS